MMTKLKDNEVATAHFNKGFMKHGPTVRALSWGTEASQKKRFKVLREIGDLKAESVLDVGCGFGDFFGFLKEERAGIENYLGLDINDNMLRVATARYPEAHFQEKDILSETPDGNFDYVFASGLFSLDSDTWTKFMQRMLTKMYALASKGIAANFLSGYTTGKKLTESRYPYPSEVTDFVVQHLTNRFILRHDYLPNDFTVYAFKSGD
jgi:ubiquinone/menaquinone biosynthesis C-methylase UbiE